MRVSGGQEDMLDGNLRLLVGKALRFVIDLARDHATVADDDGELGLAVVEHERTRVQLVVNVRGDAVLHPAVDVHTQARRDVARGRARAELFRFLSGARWESERKQSEGTKCPAKAMRVQGRKRVISSAA